MGTGKLLLIGAVVAGGAYLLMKRANAASAAPIQTSSAPSVPPGYTPPSNAIVVNLTPAATPLNLPLTLASWPADPGQPQGQFILIWNTANPQTFAALFYAKAADGTMAATPTILSMGTDPASMTIANSIAQISAAVQAQNAGTSAAASGLGRVRALRGLGGSVLPRYAAINGVRGYGEYFAA